MTTYIPIILGSLGLPLGLAYSYSFFESKNKLKRESNEQLIKDNVQMWTSCASKRINFNSIINNDSDIWKHASICGDDAFFVSDNAWGVADGVGGWDENGVSSAFASSLMFESKCVVDSGILDPKKIVDMAYTKTKKNVIAGSSTACVATLDKDILNIYNIGDSGAMIIRDKKIIIKTKELVRKFNTPYQLGVWGFWDKDELEYYDKKGYRVDDGVVENIKVAKGDILIVSTDGILDNLQDDEIITITTRDIMNSSKNLVKAAAVSAMDSSKKEAFENGEKGGKIDDLTVIVKLF